MSERAQKCENYDICKQNYTLELFIALKWPILAGSAQGEI